MNEPLWITEAEVVQIVTMPRAVRALEATLHLQAAGSAVTMNKTHATWGNGDTLHAIGAVVPGRETVGTKTWAHTEGGATPLLILYGAHDGALRAVIEAFALGQFRTGAMSAVGTAYLAAADAAEMAMIGTGKQALAQIAAVRAVRPLRIVRIYGPTAEKRAAFVARVRTAFPEIAVRECTSVAEAVAGAPIVTLATRAGEPFLHCDHLAPGTHLNAIGAIVPSRIEFDPALFDRCALAAVDTVDAVQRLSREFMEYFGTQAHPWSEVKAVATLVSEGASRPPDADLTIFIAMGMGLSDLALGMDVLDEARRRGFGRAIAPPKRAHIDFGAAPPLEPSVTPV